MFFSSRLSNVGESVPKDDNVSLLPFNYLVITQYSFVHLGFNICSYFI